MPLLRDDCASRNCISREIWLCNVLFWPSAAVCICCITCFLAFHLSSLPFHFFITFMYLLVSDVSRSPSITMCVFAVNKCDACCAICSEVSLNRRLRCSLCSAHSDTIRRLCSSWIIFSTDRHMAYTLPAEARCSNGHSPAHTPAS